MYNVIFKRDYGSNPYKIMHDDYVKIAGPFRSVAAAAEARKCSGDLVVDAKTLDVVPDPLWLWDWELNDPQTYAHRHVLHALESR